MADATRSNPRRHDGIRHLVGRVEGGVSAWPDIAAAQMRLLLHVRQIGGFDIGLDRLVDGRVIVDAVPGFLLRGSRRIRRCRSRQVVADGDEGDAPLLAFRGSCDGADLLCFRDAGG